MPLRILNVAIVGCGEVAQVIHLPTLSLLTHLYNPIMTCDTSQTLSRHCARKFHIPTSTTAFKDVLDNPSVDVIFILTSDEYHETYTVAALRAGKHVMLEKPMTLSLASSRRILDAEREVGGRGRVFVGYMRRYARSFTGAFKREVEAIPRILYARVRDFSGPNAYFVNGSGTFSVRDEVGPDESATDERAKLGSRLVAEAWDGLTTETPTSEQEKLTRFLNTLGSHDISLMRETLGPPDSVSSVTANHPFYTATFDYHNKDGHAFTCTYESGIDGVPTFDAHLAIYGEKKRVKIEYDSPYVKGLGIKVVVDEVNGDGEVQRREMLTSYEDAYTTELAEMWECIVEGRGFKTSAEDAVGELRVFDMMYRRFGEGGSL